MAQQDYSYVAAPHAIYSNNLDVLVHSTFESIVLENICTTAITNFSLLIKNQSSVGNITKITVYGTPNRIDFYVIESDIFNGVHIGPGEIQHAEFVVVAAFVRVTVQTDADITIDIHLNGNLT